MGKYILKRILLFIPTLIVISLLAFIISLNSPTDPVEKLVQSAANDSDLNAESSATEKLRFEVRKRLGLDLPVFYISLGSIAECDTLYRVADRSHQDMLSKLTSQYGNWSYIESYYHTLLTYSIKSDAYKPDSISKIGYTKNQLNNILNETSLNVRNLLEISDDIRIVATIKSLRKSYSENSILFEGLSKELGALETAYEQVKNNRKKWKIFIPNFTWNGMDNQYNLWLFGSKKRNRLGIIRGDFGSSYIDNKPVGQKMKEMFPYSFFLVVVSIILAYFISIPLGIYSAYKKGALFDNVSSVVVFMLYSLPSFFVATWLLYKFANPDNYWWFHPNGVKDPDTYNNDWGFLSLDKIRHQAPYFVLPIIAFTYSSFAFISRIMRVSMIDVMASDYIRTARAKGLSEKRVVLKHALKNALLPIITMFSNIFPAAIGGSVILETIFGIPGMGSAIYEAVLGVDIPMIVAVFTLTGVLTVIGYLSSDILYVLADPRISYEKK